MTDRPLYVCIPNFMLRRPPIAHRGGDSDLRVTPFEFAVLAGVLVAARRGALSEQRFQHAWQAGGRPKIEQQREYVSQFRQDWQDTKQQRRRGASKHQAPAPRMRHAFDARRYYDSENERNEADMTGRRERNAYRPLKRRKLIKLAGREGFAVAYQRQRDAPAPAMLAVTVSRYGLLRDAGLADTGPNRDKLDAALNRLCQPIGDAVSLLSEWRADQHGLHLQVRGDWLDPPYQRLPLPLPKSSNVLALYLFLNSINTGSVRRNAQIDCARLFDLLGMAWRRSRVLDQTLRLLNQHLVNLTLERRKALAACRPSINPPTGYEIEATGNVVRFTDVPFQWHDDELDEIESDDAAAMDDMGDAIHGGDSDDELEADATENEADEADDDVVLKRRPRTPPPDDDDEPVLRRRPRTPPPADATAISGGDSGADADDGREPEREWGTD
jgi:hypothetical protein